MVSLAKVHKAETPLRPVLQLPCSSYKNVNKTLANFFGNIDGAEIETNCGIRPECTKMQFRNRIFIDQKKNIELGRLIILMN